MTPELSSTLTVVAWSSGLGKLGYSGCKNRCSPFTLPGPMNCNGSHLVKQGHTAAPGGRGEEVMFAVAEFREFLHLTSIVYFYILLPNFEHFSNWANR